MTLKTLDIQEARALILQSQLLDHKTKLKGKQDTLKVFEQLGYIQIDTLSVVARAHHHVLSTRVSDYKHSYLKSLDEEDRAVFEYWAHAASYLPMRDYRFTLTRKAEIATGNGFWYKKKPKLMAYVLDRIRDEGPLMSRDFKNPHPKPSSSAPVWSSNPIKQSIHQLFMEGKIMVQSRKGFQKVYDLTERVLPDDVDRSVPSQEEYMRYLILRDIRAHRLIKARDMAYLVKNIKSDLKSTLGKMITDGAIEEVQIKGQQHSYFALPESIEQIPSLNTTKMRILSPFDNVLIQRRRTEELFDFKYTLECYVPAPKRVVGYFSLPLMMGTRFVGQMDAKVDRKTDTFWIKNLVWEKKVRPSKKLHRSFSKAVWDFARFNGCTSIEVQSDLKKLLHPQLLEPLDH